MLKIMLTMLKDCRERRIRLYGNRYISGRIYCPFYRYQDSKSVVCEGPGNSRKIELFFNNKDDRDRYMQQVCENDFEGCMIYTGKLAEIEEGEK